jgi:hypothetical protein
MQWNGVQSNPDRPAPLRSLMELLQRKAEPYVTEYGENQLPGAGQLLNSILRTGTEMVPGVGDLLGAEDLQTAAQNNDLAGIGLGALAAIPGIPSFSRGARGDIRATGRAVREAAEAMPAQYADPSTGAIEVEVLPPEPDYPIRAYHGSPHSFDRFSLDKIGTGEGAQAYGHGLYFAESEDVARGYRDTLAGDGLLRPDGTIWNPQSLQHINVRVAANRNGADLDATIARAREVLGRAVESSPPETVAMARADLAELEALRDAGGVRLNPGSMYEVGINADPNTFLDWDRPLSEQPEPVRSALSDMRPDATGGQILESSRLVPGDYFDRQAATRALAERGIPGIRYLDAGSRGVGQGSSNYVVFNDELVKILRKYGIGGLSTTVGASALAEELDRRGQTQEF